MAAAAANRGGVAARRRPSVEAQAGRLPAGRRKRPAATGGVWLPSRRSLAAGLALLAAGLGAYAAARETSLFAVQEIAVESARPDLAARVRRALRPLLGSSLVAFEAGDADRLLARIPDIAAVRYDRDFPHTLRVAVRQERAVALLRQGSQAWLASAAGRALRLVHRPYPPLPRVWIPRSVDVISGERLTGPVALALRTLAPLVRAPFPVPVRAVRASETELTLVLATGTEVRLADGGDLALKLAVARTIVSQAGNARYIDVSTPERVVAGYGDQGAARSNPQVES